MRGERNYYRNSYFYVFREISTVERKGSRVKKRFVKRIKEDVKTPMLCLWLPQQERKDVAGNRVYNISYFFDKLLLVPSQSDRRSLQKSL